MPRRRPLVAPAALASLGLVAACGPAGLEPEAEQAPLIIGAVDFEDVGRLDPGSEARVNSRAVGYLSLPARGTRCTAFLIAPDVIMTNHHCVPTPAAAEGARFDPTREAGVPYSARIRYACDARIGADSTLDFALLRCAGRPGDTFGVVALSGRAARVGEGVYVVQQNCDYYSRPGCATDKVLARGRITRAGARLSHDADTLGGSSGSPVFSADEHEVVGLHNAGVGNDGEGRGTSNRAVPMQRILPALRARFPEIALGAAAPSAGLSGPVGPDALEPNDGADRASPLEPYAGLTVHPGDQDVFALALDARASVQVELTFAHGLGDLDAELRAGGPSGPVVASAVSGDDDERLEVAGLEPGVYYLRVYGYAGATNTYDLDVAVRADPDRGPPPAGEPAPPPPSGALLEPNEDPASAPAVALPFDMQDGLQISDGADVDYFAFDADGAPRRITLRFLHADGDLDLYVEDGAGRILGRSAGVSDVETITEPLPAGRYFVKVIGYASATGAYGLRIE